MQTTEDSPFILPRRRPSKSYAFWWAILIVLLTLFIMLAFNYCHIVPLQTAPPLATFIQPCVCLPNHFVVCNSNTSWDATIQGWAITCTLPSNTTFAVFVCPDETLWWRSLNVTENPPSCKKEEDIRCAAFIFMGVCMLTFFLGIVCPNVSF